jgi:exonuclease VII small subunit
LELDRIVAELEEERDRLDQAITLLRELDQTATARKAIATNARSNRIWS